MVSVEQVQGWAQHLEALHHRIARRFARSEQRQRSLAYLKALLAPLERKNGWQVAEQMGATIPDGVQRLLNAADWNADSLRDDLRAYVVEHLGDPEAVLVLDETGFLKKGDKSVGVQRQYSGTAGRIENCQVGVFLCYASPKSAAFLDRTLYMPKDWVFAPERRCEAGVPSDVRFATKPELGRKMLERALAAQVPFGWVTGDCVYGGERRLRLLLEEHRRSFVLAVTSQEKLWFGGPTSYRASEIAARIAPEEWQSCSAGQGTKGERLYEWGLLELWRLQLSTEERQWGHYLLVRRRPDAPGALAFYVVFCRREQATLEQLVPVAGSRWHIESGFESAKGDCGLDQYEVRKWNAWYRHITLALLAHAFLSVMRHQAQSEAPEVSQETPPAQKGDRERD